MTVGVGRAVGLSFREATGGSTLGTPQCPSNFEVLLCVFVVCFSHFFCISLFGSIYGFDQIVGYTYSTIRLYMHVATTKRKIPFNMYKESHEEFMHALRANHPEWMAGDEGAESADEECAEADGRRRGRAHRTSSCKNPYGISHTYYLNLHNFPKISHLKFWMSRD